MRELSFPKSFPNNDEELFLKLLLCEGKEFASLWNEWRSKVAFEDIDHSTLKLLPLLHLRLRKQNIHDDITDRIKGVYKLAWFKNNLLIDATTKVIHFLSEHGVPSIALKGILMLAEIYKDDGARLLGDADILIDAVHLKKVIEKMQEIGWRLDHLPFPFSQNHVTESLLISDMEATFVDKNENHLDIHFKLFNEPVTFFSGVKNHPMTYGELLKDSHCISIKRVECCVPSREDLLVHVISHGAEYNADRPIRWVVDAISIIRDSQLDWDRLIDNAKKYQCELEIYFALTYLIQKWGISVPERSVERLNKIELSRKKVKRYYRFANHPPFHPFGNVPLLWKVYTRYESNHTFPLYISGFFDYLVRAYELKTKSQLLSFAIAKYKNKLHELKSTL